MNSFKKLSAVIVLGLGLLNVLSAIAGEKNKMIALSDVESIKASSQDYGNNAEFAMDGNSGTRWESTHGVDPSWIQIILKEKKEVSSLKIIWETASAAKYKIRVSENGTKWDEVAAVEDGKQGEEKIITFKPLKIKYLRIVCEERTTAWGYSIFEIQMNPEEVNMPDFDPSAPYNNKSLSPEKRASDLVSRMTLREKIALLSGAQHMNSRTNNRLKIPELRVMDGPHGLGGGKGHTCFPTGVSLGSTWDTDLINEVGVALARETRALDKHILLGPCVNIHRTPLGGRNFESYSEDPYLTARIAVAYVKGVQSEKIGTSTKHYACNNEEWERFTISTEIDERTLREIYLPAFKAAVKDAETLTIMGAYNRINGDYACANKHLLNDILKGEWGFKGFVVSDWGAVHATTETLNSGCDLEMPGPGKFLTEKEILPEIEKGNIKEETITVAVGRILKAMFWLGLFDEPDPKYKGALDTPEHRALARRVAENAIVLLKNNGGVLPLDEKNIKSIAVIGPNAETARLGGGGSSTVVPSYSVSPLDALREKYGDKISINFAKGSVDVGDIEDIPAELLSTPDSSEHGLKAEYFKNKDFQGPPAIVKVDKKINFLWENRAPIDGFPADGFSVRWTGKFTPKESKEYNFSLTSDDGGRFYIDGKLLIDNWGDHAANTAKKSIYLQQGRAYDMKVEYFESSGDAVMKFGYNQPNDLLLPAAVEAAKKSDAAVIFAGLNNNLEGEGVDKKNMLLPEGQDELIAAVGAANKNTIVVLINGTPVEMWKWLDKVPAVIEAWYPGEEGGNAIANILFGEVNPSGKMSTTFPKKYEDNASAKNYPGKDGKVYYEEGIFVGYRHFDKNNIEPQFPFGHGLSYTKFEYSNLKINPKNVSSYPFEISIDVKNTGAREGKEVVQLYVSDVKSSLPRPVKELKAFKKINLKPGEIKTVKFSLGKDALSFYDPAKKGWVAEPGEFKILAGSSSRDIRLESSFTLK